MATAQAIENHGDLADLIGSTSQSLQPLYGIMDCNFIVTLLANF